MKILFLHLSDLHLSQRSDVNETCVQEIGKALCPQSIGAVDKIFVLVTGDIAFNGQVAQYRAFHDLKNLLISALKDNVLSNNLIHIFIVPGNHDIDYQKIEGHDRGFYEEVLETGKDILDECEVDARIEFLRYSGRNHGINAYKPFMYRHVVAVNGFSVEVNLLNSTFFSLKTKNDQGLHYLPKEISTKLLAPTGADMAITLMHHSHQWFNDMCSVDLEKALFEKNTMIFYGHEHYLAGKTIAYNGNAPAHVFCGGCLCNRGDWSKSEFFACVYDTAAEEFVRYEFKWNEKASIYQSAQKEKRWLEPKCSTNIPKTINEEYVAELVKDSHVRLSDDLADYYVFPGVTSAIARKDDHANDITTFEHFRKEFEKTKRFEISGGDSAGKSALLKMVFKHYLSKKCILLCKVDDISSGNRKRIIKNLFMQTYGDDPAEYSKFERLDRSQKMILIDDLHLIDPKNVAGFLNGIEEDFDYIIYTTNNTLKLDIQARIRASIIEDTYSCYRILPLYSPKRFELVNRVIPLKNPSITTDDQRALTEKITQSLDLQRRYIPLTPEIILQFVDYYLTYQLESAQNDGSIFSKVFESSITNVLSPYVVSPLTVDKAFTLLGKVAYYIHTNRKYPITHKEIIDVIAAYCEEYGGKVDSIAFIDSAAKAHILCKYGEDGEYKFCNNNYLAYFVAHEICGSRNKDAVQRCLDCACFGINATILMFVTYLTHDESLIGIIWETACAVTSSWKEFSFDMQEISHLNGLVTSPRLKAPSKGDCIRDRAADELRDREEIESATVDIVGIYDYNEQDIDKLENQVVRALSLLILLARCLPNFEHRLKRKQKNEVVTALYQLPNKIFWAWACEVEKNKEELVQLILELNTNEFTRHKITDADAKTILQWNSLSLLLEFYYGVAENAYRENTFEYLSDLAREIVGFGEETHALELLVILDKARKVAEFQTEAVRLKEESKRSVVQLALGRAVHHMLVKGVLTQKQAMQLEQEFFPNADHSKMLYQRKISEKEK